MNTKIKVCGLTRWEEMSQLAELGVDYGGLIFHAPSPRFAEGKMDAGRLKKIQGIKKTGVFVHADPEYILRQKEKYGLDLIQLHGNESPEDCLRLKRELPVIKAFRLRTVEDLPITNEYLEACDYFLFDTPGALYGGNGRTFDWDLLAHYQGRLPFFLSGGIGPVDADRIKAFSHPALHAIDVNSGFESEPGEKNIAEIKKFLWDLNII